VVLRQGWNEVPFVVPNPARVDRRVRLQVLLRGDTEVPVRQMAVEVNQGKQAVPPALERGDRSVGSGPLGGTLRPGDNQVVVRLENQGAAGTRVNVTLAWQQDEEFRGTLHLLAVGVSRYRESRFNLDFADKDAEALVDAFKTKGGGGLFDRVDCEPALVNEKATKKAILKTLDRLKRQVSQHDLVIVSFSGHGDKDDSERFYFLPHDHEPDDTLANSGVSWDDLRTYLGHMPCLVLVVMDTCHSGAVSRATALRGADDLQRAIDRAVKQFADSEKGMVVMAGCLSDQSGLEAHKWKHGALTLALLEGVTGRRIYDAEESHVPLPGAGVLSLRGLDFYVTGRVKELAGGRQAVVTNHTGNISLDDVPVCVVGPPAAK
jgi:hypothetical protein